MAAYIKRGESLFIPFRNGRSISDSQCKPRMYKSVKNFEKTFPKHNYETQNIELVEYVEVKHGEWIRPTKLADMMHDIPHCSLCGEVPCDEGKYCPNCGAKMDGGKNEKRN